MSEDRFTTERDGFGRLLADREVWRQASTIAAAGELTARWLEGESQYQPGAFSAGVDDETRAIAGELARLADRRPRTTRLRDGLLQPRDRDGTPGVIHPNQPGDGRPCPG